MTVEQLVFYLLSLPAKATIAPHYEDNRGEFTGFAISESGVYLIECGGSHEPAHELMEFDP